MYHKLSVIISCYNEEKTIVPVLQKVLSADLQFEIMKEIIIVDDASTDNSLNLIKGFIKINANNNIKLIVHSNNKGKGASIRSGIAEASGDLIIMQDADLEYDPHEYYKLIGPIYNGNADVVFGSRFRGDGPHRVLFFMHSIGNKLLTFLSNLFTGLNLTDMETCYKIFKSVHLKQIKLKENRFGFEPEVTAKIARIPDIRIYEVGISYYGRSYKEGKKINWRDGMKAIYCIFRYNLFR